ncbi:MAG: hypothetical protein KAG97_13240, partial [Victivallales bacterium]|nr:hypothetical protein [Victivallales bacterium]
MFEIRSDLLPKGVFGDLEIIQLTSGETPCSHVYMEAQIFTPDSKRFILHESALPHYPGVSDRDPLHRYMICDIENDCALSPITDEIGTKAPSFSPDGRHLYYFVDETEVNGGRLILKRVGVDGSDRRTLLVLDKPPEGAATLPSRIYPLSSIRSDGAKIALSCFCGDGNTEKADWGLMIFDLRSLSVNMILSGPSWCNIHPQYSRSRDPERKCDILVQENHGYECDVNGENTRFAGGKGADIHSIRDDGSNFRVFPWGRDELEYCQGHQCWRGTSDWAITSTISKPSSIERLIESKVVEGAAGHDGSNT